MRTLIATAAPTLVLMILCCGRPAWQQPVPAREYCCSTFREMAFAPLNLDIAQRLILTDRSPYFTFSSGRSYYAAFSTAPGAAGAIRVRVKAHRTSYGLTAFCPSLVFLDQAFESIDNRDVSLQFVLPDERAVGYYEGATTLPPEAAYFVVYSTQLLAATRVPFQSYNYYTGLVDSYTIPCWATGDMQLLLIPPSDTAG